MTVFERTIHFLLSPSVPIGNIFVVMWVRGACAGDIRFGELLVGGEGIHTKISSAVRAHGMRVGSSLQFTLRHDAETI